MRLVAITLLFLGLAAPARAEDPSITDGSAQKELDAARAAWNANGFANYRVTVRRSCFCPDIYTRAYTVHVRDGKPVDPPSIARNYASVTRLHDIVQHAIDSKVDVLSVSYAENGMPESIAVNPDLNTFDEEDGYSARALHEEDATFPRKVDERIQTGEAQDALDAARARWAEKGFDSYSFRQHLACFCPTQYTRARTLTVRNGRPVDPPRALRSTASVPRLFRTVQRAIRDKVAGLTVTYAKNGLPRDIFIDRDNRVADEELGIVTRRLRRR